ncbi:hypothetical protein QCE62_05585 [Caballeronia sp. LZ033]|uniref:hypothetical protein n=1 Tax=Caballeronia sp. LZ033 TaxID=3038566 RepID=UPI00285A8461|nr:hypothetical protein [Caballeronia sp. LZ033]MDR5813061.1 hypothetical protein [Caballeronia sp. LZ033]
MQLEFLGRAWEVLLDDCIRQYLENGASEVPFPDHEQCSFDGERVILRKQGRIVGTFVITQLVLDSEISFTLRDETTYPTKPVFTKPSKRGRHAR